MMIVSALCGTPPISPGSQDLGLNVKAIERALALPPGTVTSAGTLSKPKPKIKISIGHKMISCGVARGLSAPETPALEVE